MGRGKGEGALTAATPRPKLSAEEKELIEGIREHGIAPLSYLKRLGTARTLRPMIEGLERRGEVIRVYNGMGKQVPWWWEVARKPPSWYTEPPYLEKGQIWDWGDPSNRVFVEVKRGVNEYGLPRVMVKAGENNQVDTVLPPHYFGWALHQRKRGEVSDYSRHFMCPVHGECTDDMVKTDKTCALCGLALDRV